MNLGAREQTGKHYNTLKHAQTTPTHLDLVDFPFSPGVELIVEHGEVRVALGVRAPGHVAHALLPLHCHLRFPVARRDKSFMKK
jgi:hypothetical protein